MKTTYFRTIDRGQQGNWYYDINDLSSIDNTGTVIVSSDGKRFKRIYSNSLNVSWFGAIGDGIIDDAENINKTISNAKSGETVEFEKEKIYLIGSQINVNASIRIKGNNATIMPTAALTTTTGAAINMSKIKYFQSGLSISVSKNNNSITLPDGMTAKRGDLILVKGPDIYYAFTPENSSFNYKKGQFAIVSSVSGQNVTLASNWFDSFNVSSIAVYEGFNNASIEGLYVDLTNQANSQNQFVGINAAGTNIKISGCTFTGNRYSLIGVLIEGETNSVTNSNFYNFFNTQGFSNGGRLGYGIQSNSNNIIVNNNFFYDCKHAFTTGPREFVVRGVTVSNNSFYEDPNRSFTPNGINPLTDYSGTIDAHAGVSGTVCITGNIVYSHGRSVFIRNGNAIISNNSFYQMSNPIGILATEEKPPENIVFENNEVELLNLATSSIWSNYESLQTLPGTVKNINIKSNNVKNGSLVGVYSLKFDVENLTVKDNIHNNAIYGVLIFGNNTSRYVSNTLIEHNTINLRSGTGVDFGIAFTNNVADSRNINYINSKIINNTINSIANTGQGYSLIMNNGFFSNTIIDKNTLTRGIGQTWSGRNIQFQSGKYIDFNFINNIFDTAITFQSGSDNDYILENASISNNRKGYLIQFSESTNATKFIFNKVNLSSNVLSASNSDPLISFINQPSSTSWASSKDVLIQNNHLYNSSINNSIYISTNSIGHKIIVIDNILSASVNDQSSTFYGPIRNKLINGVQPWKGGTTVLENGEINNISAPTSGAWTRGDKIYNSSVSQNGLLGWVCTSTGTPGSWVNISLDSSAYIRNQISQQNGDFNVSGSGRIGTNLVAGGTITANVGLSIAPGVAFGTSSSASFSAGRAMFGWDGSKGAVAIRGSDNTKTIVFGGGTTDYATVFSTYFTPNSSNTMSLGTSALFWSNAFLINLRLSKNGLLKGNGSGADVSAAIADIDYATPASVSLKQNLVTLTTTGSGAATFNQSTGALNIPTTANEVILNKTANYTITQSDLSNVNTTVVYANATAGNITITLPSVANSTGRKIIVFKTDATANTITLTGSANINGSATYMVTAQYSSVEIHANGTQYYAK